MALAAPDRHPPTIRPIRPADAPSLQDFVRALDPRSRYLRFHGAINGCTPGLLRQLTEVDGVRHVAFIALDQRPQGPAIAGEARYVVNSDVDAAEFAICVGDGWRGRGVADALMRQLLDAARAAGIGWLYGDVLAGNTRMAGLMRRHGFAPTWQVDAGPDVERWERAVRARPLSRARGWGRWLGLWSNRAATLPAR